VKSIDNSLCVVVSAVVGSKGVLLVKREKPPFAGQWGLPGGKVKYGEHLDGASVREVMEETGVSCRFQRFTGAVTEVILSRGKPEMHYVLLVCRLKPAGSGVRSSAEGQARWFRLAELAEIDMIPSDRLILDRLVLRQPCKLFYKCCVRRSGRQYHVVSFL